MRQNLKYFYFLLIGTILLSVIFVFLTNYSFNLVTFVNMLFYFSTPSFIIGGFLLVLQSGFFNITGYAFKKFFGTQKDPNYEVKKDSIYTKNIYYLAKPIFFSGLILFVSSFVLSMFV
ncbi:MAG: hypothetical protein K0S51_926 [Bacillales bacterium]|nr:hypothetical protein [Bacillales bacterium]